MNAQRLQKLARIEGDIKSLKEQIAVLTEERDEVRDQLRPELERNEGEWIRSGGISIKFKRNAPSDYFDFAAFKKRYGILPRMRPYLKERKATETWTIKV